MDALLDAVLEGAERLGHGLLAFGYAAVMSFGPAAPLAVPEPADEPAHGA